jgi:hypothetical protein
LAHECDLGGLLIVIILIDADCINPEENSASYGPPRQILGLATPIFVISVKNAFLSEKMENASGTHCNYALANYLITITLAYKISSLN